MRPASLDPLAGQRPAPRPTSFSQPFWEAARDGRFLIQVCTRTGNAQFFPRPVSIWTGRRDIEWREVSGYGTIYSYTITHHAPPPYKVETPYAVALVDLDEKIRVIGNLVNCRPVDAAIGRRVRLVWVTAGSQMFPAFELDEHASGSAAENLGATSR